MIDFLQAQVPDSYRFDRELHMDSLDFLDAVLRVEEAFQVKIPAADLVHIETVGEMRAWLVSHAC